MHTRVYNGLTRKHVSRVTLMTRKFFYHQGRTGHTGHMFSCFTIYKR